ncbi:MAG TPA: hypothetical protein PKU97_14030 [Kofleriaceae bacterium]|nr:hypothetical protein [Kofleriaceae bacterium]
MKLLLAALSVVGAFVMSSAGAAPSAATAAPTVAPATQVSLQAQGSDEEEAACQRIWFCDEPYATFPSLAACRASACSVQCDWFMECTP